MQLRKKALASLVTLLLLITVFGAATAAYATTTPAGPATVNIETDVTDCLILRQSGSTLQYSRDSGSNWTDYSGTITVTGSGTATSNTIVVLCGTHNVTLSGVNIDVSATNSACAFSLLGSSTVNLTLAGTNALKSGWYMAGLQVPGSTTVNVSGAGSLSVVGGSFASGIGGACNESCGTISITGGSVTVAGGGGGAGIGSGDCDQYSNAGGTISITGGTVNATGGIQGAGIGGGKNAIGCTVTIGGGTVIASGYDRSGYYGGAGIGSGYHGSSTVTITGGTVTATGAEYGAGIGGTGAGNGGPITITGGSVSATGGYHSAGIGGGGEENSIGGGGGLVTITGGTVTAIGGEDGGAGIGAAYGSTDNGVCHISGGSVNVSSMSPVPTVSSSDSTPVYLTTVTIPGGGDAAVTALTITQNSIPVSYGIKDMTADSGVLYLYLPANVDTTASVTAGGTSYNGYYGPVASTGTNVLKMDQSVLTVTGVSSSYTYGAAISPSTSGGSGDGAVTYSFSGTGSTSYTDSTAPSNAGAYTVTATKAADDSYYEAVSAAVPFTIGRIATTVTAAPTASNIVVIGKLSASTLTGGTGSVGGTFAWTNPNTVVSKTGSYEVTFTPTSSNYSPSTYMVTVTVLTQITDAATGVIYDFSGVSLPQGVTAVSVVVSIIPNSGAGASTYTTVGNLIGGTSQTMSVSQLLVYSLSLQDQNGNPISGFTGSVIVRLPIPAGMSGDLHVYWYDTVSGTTVDMNAAKDGGYLVFSTTHFSTYSIAELKAVSPKPGTGDSTSLLFPAALLLLSVSGLAVSLKLKSRKQ